MNTALARLSDPSTSHEAAARVSTAELELVVRRTLSRHPEGLTTREIHEITGVDHVSVSPRLKPLERKELVVRAGRRDGSTVWRLIYADVDACDHSPGLLVYLGEWPDADLFTLPSLHHCAGCGTSVSLPAPVRGGARIIVRNDVRRRA